MADLMRGGDTLVLAGDVVRRASLSIERSEFRRGYAVYAIVCTLEDLASDGAVHRWTVFRRCACSSPVTAASKSTPIRLRCVLGLCGPYFKLEFCMCMLLAMIPGLEKYCRYLLAFAGRNLLSSSFSSEMPTRRC